MNIRKAVLKSFDSGDYTATVQVSGSDRVYLEDVTVARNILSSQLIAGRELAVLFFDENNVKEAVVVAVFGI